MTMWHDESESWDNRRPPPAAPRGQYVHPTDVDGITALEPWFFEHWRGPTNPDEARAADRVLVDLGRILFEREMRKIEKRNGY